MAAAIGVGGDGGVSVVLRERAEEREGSMESERGSRGRVASPRSSGGKQGGRRWPSACRRAVATRLVSFWREVGDGGGSVGWAAGIGPGGLRGERQVGFLSSLLFLFLFFLFCVVLV